MRHIIFIFFCLFFGLVSYAQDDEPAIGYSIDSSLVSAPLSRASAGNVFSYKPDFAAKIISVVGEPDIIRPMTILPGVSSGMEGSLGLFVRGGNQGTLRFEIDGVPVYYPTHLFGLVSSIQSDMISHVEASLGGWASSSGNFTSGKVSAFLKHRKTDRLKISASASPLIEGLYAEFPGFANIRAGGRVSFLPKAVGLFSKRNGFDVDGIVYDISANSDIYTRFGRISTGIFIAKDSYSTSDGNISNLIAWNSSMSFLKYIPSEKLNFLAYWTSTASQEGVSYFKEGKLSSSVNMKSSISELALKATYADRWSDKIKVEGGGELMYQQLGTQLSAFLQGDFIIPEISELSLGIRPTLYFSDKVRTGNFDFHILAKRKLKSGLSVELSFDRAVQYFHSLEGLPSGWSMNLTVPLKQRFPEEVTYQYYGGADYNATFCKDTKFHASIGCFYKEMKGVVSYISSVNMFKNTTDTWEYDADSGKGRAGGEGANVSISGDWGNVDMSYSFSRTFRQYPNINGGNTFPFKFDRPHILNILSSFNLYRKRNSFGKSVTHSLLSGLSLASGNLMTIGLRQYRGVLPPYWNWNTYGYPMSFIYNILGRTEMSSMNGVRMPAYFRIDLGYSIEIHGKRATHIFDFTVYNVLNRHNPYLIFNDDGKWKQLSLIPVFPSIRWKIII